MSLSEEYKNNLRKRIEKARKTVAPENAVGQWIANFVAAGIEYDLKSIVSKLPTDDYNLNPPPRKKTWHLQSKYGELKQIDHVISDKKGNPIIIIEDKWLKDQRHLKDKGSWIIALKTVKEAYPSLRGIIAILAGDWNKTTIKVLQKIAYVFHIPLETVYTHLKKAGIEVKIDKKRQAFENPEELLDTILDVVETNLNKDIDVMTKIGKRITRKISKKLEKTIRNLLYPKTEETAQEYEFLIKTNWGRVRVLEGKCVGIDPDELMRKVKRVIESS